MYYLAKIAQAGGLTVIMIGFLKSLPNLIDKNIFIIGAILFGLGWVIETFFLQK